MIWLRILIPFFVFASGFAAGWYKTERGWTKKYTKLESTYAVAKARWDAQVSWANGEGKKQDEASTNELRGNLANTQADLAAARNELRIARSKRPALQPAASAPATCGTFEAPPSRLSLADADFLAGLAAEADDTVNERNTCIEKYNAVKSLLDQLQGK